MTHHMPIRAAVEEHLVRFFAHIDATPPADPAEAVERRLTKGIVGELLRAYADFSDLEVVEEVCGSHIENALANGLMTIVMTTANDDPIEGARKLEVLWDNVLHRTRMRMRTQAHPDIVRSSVTIAPMGRA